MSTPLVELKQVSERFDDRKVGAGDHVSQRFDLTHPPVIVHVADGVDLAIQPGEVVGLVGESGCDKSVLGHIVTDLMPSSAGEVRVDGKAVNMLTAGEARIARLKIQMIFQDPYASLNLRLHMGEIIGETAHVHGLTNRADFADYVAAQMQRAGLDPALCNRYPHQFSDDQRQRIGIACTLVVQPSVLVYDEAVVALDVSTQAQILNLFMDLREQPNLTYLFISHDLGVVEHLSDRVVIMYLGCVMESAPTGEVFRHPNHPYTQTLLAEIPRLSARHKTLTAIQGEMSSPLHPLTGCHFHPRCPRAMPRCRTETPTLRGIAISHISAYYLNNAT